MLIVASPTCSDSVTSYSTTIHCNTQTREAVVRYAAGAALASTDGAFLIDALTSWIGEDGLPFAVLAFATGLRATNAEYRANVGRFFRAHRDRACIAILNAGPVIHIIVEMFRIGTGIQLKGFGDEVAARAWFRTKGIAA